MLAKTSGNVVETARPPVCWPQRIALAALAMFVAVGGVLGGLQMLVDPVHPMGLSPQLIAATPYDSYTQPGILLLILMGAIPLVVAIALLVRAGGAVAGAGLLGAGLMAWIVVQWAWLAERLWLQPVIFGVGALIFALALLTFRRGAR